MPTSPSVPSFAFQADRMHELRPSFLLAIDIGHVFLRGARDGSAPSSASRFRTSSVASSAFNSRFSRSTIGRGVPAGASSVERCVASKPGRPASAMVGMSGSRRERCRLLTPSARSVPAATLACAAGSEQTSSRYARREDRSWPGPCPCRALTALRRGPQRFANASQKPLRPRAFWPYNSVTVRTASHTSPGHNRDTAQEGPPWLRSLRAPTLETDRPAQAPIPGKPFWMKLAAGSRLATAEFRRRRWMVAARMARAATDKDFAAADDLEASTVDRRPHLPRGAAGRRRSIASGGKINGKTATVAAAIERYRDELIATGGASTRATRRAAYAAFDPRQAYPAPDGSPNCRTGATASCRPHAGHRQPGDRHLSAALILPPTSMPHHGRARGRSG